MTLRKALLCAILFASTEAWSQISIEPEILCWYRAHHKDSLCPKLSHLKMRLDIPWSDQLSFKLAYDPGAVPKISWYDTYTLRAQQLPPRQSWLADYGIRYKLSKHWELSVEDWTASTLLPDASGLSYSRALQDSGWNQTAARLTYAKQDGITATAIFGLGEGERLQESDKEPYVGALVRLPLFTAFDLQMGASLDKDSLHSDSLWWIPKEEREEAAEGFRAERSAIALVLDGSLPAARGLQASVGWQRNRLKNSRDDSLAVYPRPAALDPTEALPSRGGITRESRLISGSYAILAEYIIAFQLADLELTFDDPEAFSCSSLDEGGFCREARTESRRIRVRGRSFGLGKIDVDGWSLLLETHEERYDRLYESYHFASGINQRQKSVRIISTRLAWTW